MYRPIGNGVSIVLVRPKRSANIGSAARAMNCMGFSDLVLIQPRCQIDRTAFNLAVGSSHILENARIFNSLDECLKDYSLVAGTTKRFGKKRHNFVGMRQFCRDIMPRHTLSNTAILFGAEDYGLCGEHLKKCQYLISFPVNDDFGSLNLSQAVMAACYELKASFDDRTFALQTQSNGISDQQMRLLALAIDQAVEKSRFPLKKGSASTAGKLKEIFARSNLSVPELRQLLSFARHICYLGEHLP